MSAATQPAILVAIQSAWIDEIRAQAVACEARRPFTRKPVSTGTISEAACLYLRIVCERVRPIVAVEIGTFIGTSALVLASVAARVYTCDKDNDAMPSTERITCYPQTSSTIMLAELAQQGIKADLFFFDGRIQDADLPLIVALATPRAVFAFDDYEGHEKGVVNVQKLRPYVSPAYRLIEPPIDVDGLPSRTTIALLERPA
jgi:predicted O-methyltransferase YrrM